MKPISLFIGGLFVSAIGVAQNSPDSAPNPSAPAPDPVIITPGQSQSALQELSPPLRPGRRGGVYITGASPTVSGTNVGTPIIITSATNVLPTNYVGATGAPVGTNIGAGANNEMAPPAPGNDFIFVPTLNQPGLPGAIGGRGLNPNSGSANTTPTPAPSDALIPPAGTGTPALPPAGTVTPALPPAGTMTIPPGPGAELPGSRIVPPPKPNTTPPRPISGR